MRQKAIFKIAVLLAFIGLSFMVSSIQLKNVEAFSNQVIQRGASGEDVIELQSRLKYNGFYTGKVDGVFGWGTYWALRNFQEKFGLPVDGLAGAKTKQMLVKATKYDKSTANKGNSGGTAQKINHLKIKGQMFQMVILKMIFSSWQTQYMESLVVSRT
ncbi:spore cortex-lytic enzyme [Bacillus cereus SJ1]|nr:spore cortex-lytic enzyme [Bacillus cereus SJ1]